MSGYPIQRKKSRSRRFCENSGDKNPAIKKNPKSRGLKPETQKKNPQSRGFSKNLGDFHKILKKFRWSENRKNQKFLLTFSLGIFWDFLGIFRDFQIPIRIPEILHSGFFRDYQIPIPIPGVSGFSGFFNLAQNKKFRDSGSRKNSIPKPTLVMMIKFDNQNESNALI